VKPDYEPIYLERFDAELAAKYYDNTDAAYLDFKIPSTPKEANKIRRPKWYHNGLAPPSAWTKEDVEAYRTDTGMEVSKPIPPFHAVESNYDPLHPGSVQLQGPIAIPRMSSAYMLSLRGRDPNSNIQPAATNITITSTAVVPSRPPAIQQGSGSTGPSNPTTSAIKPQHDTAVDLAPIAVAVQHRLTHTISSPAIRLKPSPTTILASQDTLADSVNIQQDPSPTPAIQQRVTGTTLTPNQQTPIGLLATRVPTDIGSGLPSSLKPPVFQRKKNPFPRRPVKPASDIQESSGSSHAYAMDPSEWDQPQEKR
jgi:hypothetical protein